MELPQILELKMDNRIDAVLDTIDPKNRGYGVGSVLMLLRILLIFPLLHNILRNAKV